MPRYYFHVWTDSDCAPDAEGIDFENAEAARAEVARAAYDLLHEDIRSGRYTVSHKIVIEDEEGATIDAVPFTMTITGLQERSGHDAA